MCLHFGHWRSSVRDETDRSTHHSINSNQIAADTIDRWSVHSTSRRVLKHAGPRSALSHPVGNKASLIAVGLPRRLDILDQWWASKRKIRPDVFMIDAAFVFLVYAKMLWNHLYSHTNSAPPLVTYQPQNPVGTLSRSKWPKPRWISQVSE